MKGIHKALILSGGILAGAAALSLLPWGSGDDPAPEQSETGAIRNTGAASTGTSTAAQHAGRLPDYEAEMRKIAERAESQSGPDVHAKLEALRAEARHRAAEDPAGALEWALAQGESQRSAMQALLDAWAGQNPAAAFAALRDLSDERHRSAREAGLGQVMHQWALDDPAAAWKALGTLPSSAISAMLRSQVLRQWAPGDPGAASVALRAMLNAGRSLDEQMILQPSFTTVAHSLALSSGAAAAQWADDFPAGAERAAAVGGVISGWAEKDPVAAAAWLEKMEPGAARDEGAAAFVRAAAAAAPETALAWAQTISDAARRSSLTAIAASRWLAAEPAKADEWLRTTDALTEQQKSLILEAERTLPKPGVLGGGEK